MQHGFLLFDPLTDLLGLAAGCLAAPSFEPSPMSKTLQMEGLDCELVVQKPC
jgi:hypothetical protein